MKCICGTTTVKTDYCVICKNEKPRHYDEHDVKTFLCPTHKFKVWCCGCPEFVCKDCAKEGWYSTAGWGGPTEHLKREPDGQ